MAVTQTNADCAGMSPISYKDSDGYWYTQIGSIRIYIGSGSPDAVITAPWGSLYCQKDAATYTWWANVDGATEWKYFSLT